MRYTQTGKNSTLVNVFTIFFSPREREAGIELQRVRDLSKEEARTHGELEEKRRNLENEMER